MIIKGVKAMKAKEEPKKFWSVKELAIYLGVSRSLLYAKVDAHDISCKRIGARILIPSSFVEKMLAS